jgi:hypothetical protein
MGSSTLWVSSSRTIPIPIPTGGVLPLQIKKNEIESEKGGKTMTNREPRLGVGVNNS